MFKNELVSVHIILINKYGVLIFFLTMVSGRVKVAPEPQKWNYMVLELKLLQNLKNETTWT